MLVKLAQNSLLILLRKLKKAIPLAKLLSLPRGSMERNHLSSFLIIKIFHKGDTMRWLKEFLKKVWHKILKNQRTIYGALAFICFIGYMFMGERLATGLYSMAESIIGFVCFGIGFMWFTYLAGGFDFT